MFTIIVLLCEKQLLKTINLKLDFNWLRDARYDDRIDIVFFYLYPASRIQHHILSYPILSSVVLMNGGIVNIRYPGE